MSSIKSIIKVHAIIIAFTGVFLSCPQLVDAQKKQSPNGSGIDGTPHTARQLRQAQWKKQRKIDKATKKALKAHLKDQTKAVRKRMRKDAKRAAKNNSR